MGLLERYLWDMGECYLSPCLKSLPSIGLKSKHYVVYNDVIDAMESYTYLVCI